MEINNHKNMYFLKDDARNKVAQTHQRLISEMEIRKVGICLFAGNFVAIANQ